MFLIPMALCAIFGSSRHLVVGADSATAAILAAGEGPVGPQFVNAVFGSLVLAFGDSDDAIFSTLTGIAGGVATLVTRSPQPIRNAAEYRDRYGPPVTWEFAPHPHGL